MREGPLVWWSQYPSAIAHIFKCFNKSGGMSQLKCLQSLARPQAALVPSLLLRALPALRALLSCQLFSWALGQMQRMQKMLFLPQRTCVSGLCPALGPFLSRSVARL